MSWLQNIFWDNNHRERFKMIVSGYLLFIKSGKILLLRRKNTGYMDGWYGLPSGHIEDNETPVQALKREVKEESGLNIEIVKLTNHKKYPTAEILPAPYGISLHSVGDHHHMDMRYICTLKGNKKLNGTEECKWFTLAEIKSLHDCPDEVKDFVKEAIKIAKM